MGRVHDFTGLPVLGRWGSLSTVVVGVRGVESPIACSQSRCADPLRHALGFRVDGVTTIENISGLAADDGAHQAGSGHHRGAPAVAAPIRDDRLE